MGRTTCGNHPSPGGGTTATVHGAFAWEARPWDQRWVTGAAGAWDQAGHARGALPPGCPFLVRKQLGFGPASSSHDTRDKAQIENTETEKYFSVKNK